MNEATLVGAKEDKRAAWISSAPLVIRHARATPSSPQSLLHVAFTAWNGSNSMALGEQWQFNGGHWEWQVGGGTYTVYSVACSSFCVLPSSYVLEGRQEVDV